MARGRKLQSSRLCNFRMYTLSDAARLHLTLSSKHDTLEPPFDNVVRLLRRMPQRPVTRIHLSSRQIRDRLLHAFAHLRLENTITEGLYEKRGLLDTIATVGRQRFLRLPVRFAGAIPVARAIDAILGELGDVEIKLLWDLVNTCSKVISKASLLTS